MNKNLSIFIICIIFLSYVSIDMINSQESSIDVTEDFMDEYCWDNFNQTYYNSTCSGKLENENYNKEYNFCCGDKENIINQYKEKDFKDLKKINSSYSSDTYFNNKTNQYVSMLYRGVVNYKKEDGNFSKINNTIIKSDECDLDYCVRKGIYHADFNEKSNGNLVRFYYNGSEIKYKLSDLTWENNNKRELISKPSNVNGRADGNTFVYENLYGEGLDLVYNYKNILLKEALIINNLSDLKAPSNNESFLNLEFELVYNDAKDKLKLSGNLEFSKEKSKNQKKNDKEIKIEDKFGNTKIKLPQPYAIDNNGDEIKLNYTLKEKGNKIYISISTPYEWIKNAEFPIQIDPLSMVYADFDNGYTAISIREDDRNTNSFIMNEFHYIGSHMEGPDYQHGYIAFNASGGHVTDLYSPDQITKIKIGLFPYYIASEEGNGVRLEFTNVLTNNLITQDFPMIPSSLTDKRYLWEFLNDARGCVGHCIYSDNNFEHILYSNNLDVIFNEEDYGYHHEYEMPTETSQREGLIWSIDNNEYFYILVRGEIDNNDNEQVFFHSSDDPHPPYLRIEYNSPPPTVNYEATSPPGGPEYSSWHMWTNDDIKNSLSCGSNCDYISYCLDTTNTCTPSTNYGTSEDVIVSTEGEYYFRYRGYGPGGWSTTQSAVNKIDKTDPIINVSAICGDSDYTFGTECNADSIILNLSVSEEASELELMYWCNSTDGICDLSETGSEEQLCELYNLDFPCDEITEEGKSGWQLVTFSDSGEYNFSVNANDYAGNYFGQENYSLILNSDTTPPEVSITYPEDITYYTEIDTLNFTVTEDNLDKVWFNYNHNGDSYSDPILNDSNPNNYVTDFGYYYMNYTRQNVSNNVNLGAYGTRINSAEIYEYAVLDECLSNSLVQIRAQVEHEASIKLQCYTGSSWETIMNLHSVLPDKVYLSLLGISNEEILDVTSGVSKSINFDLVEDFYSLTIYANDTNGNIGNDSVTFDINAETDPPEFSNFQTSPSNNTEYTSSRTNTFQVNIVDESDIDTVILELDGTNYTNPEDVGITYSKNIGSLSAGSHNYRWWANDSLGNAGYSDMKNYYIQKATAATTLSFDKSSPQTYGTEIKAICNTNNPEGVLKLYRNIPSFTFLNYLSINDTGWNGADTLNLNAPFEHCVKMKTNQTSRLNISLYIRYKEEDATYGWNNYATIRVRDLDLNLLEELNDTEFEKEVYTNNFYEEDTQYYFCYKSFETGQTLMIPRGTSTSYEYTTLEGSDWAGSNPPAFKIQSYNSSYITIANDTSELLSAGSYNYVCNVTETQNYTSESSSETFIIDKKSPTGSINSDSGWDLEYGESITISFTETNDGDSDVTYKLYKNGVDIGTGETITPEVGTYTYILNTTGGENYTSDSNMDTEILYVEDTTNPSIIYEDDTTPEGEILNQNWIFINISWTEEDLDYIRFKLYDAYSNLLDFVDSDGSINSTNFTGLSDGSYKYNAEIYDNSGNSNSTRALTTSLDTENPFVNGTFQNNTLNSTKEHNLTANITDNMAIKNYTLDIYNETDKINTTTETFEWPERFLGGLLGIVFNFENDGVYFWNWKVYDWADSYNETANYTMEIDSTYPSVEILFPEEDGYNYHNQTLNFSISDENIDTCWKRLNDGDNITINCNLNSTVNSSTQGTVEGENTIYLYANDSLGQESMDSVTFFISTSGPSISLNHPINNDYFDSGDDIDFNFTATDTDGLDTCQLWSNFSGSWDLNYTWSSPTSGDEESVKRSLTEGYYKWGIFCNDSLSTESWSGTNRTLTIDETNPLIDYNLNTTESTNLSQDFIFISIDYTENNFKNITFRANDNIQTYSSEINEHNFTDLTDDNYIVNSTVCDLAGNCNTTENKIITLDNINPSINILFPENTNYSYSPDTLNVSISDANLGECWYQYNSVNTTFGCDTNVSGISYSEGDNNIIVYANDSAENINSEEVNFLIDTIYPLIEFNSTTEINNSNLSQDYIEIGLSITEENLKNITYYLYNDSLIDSYTSLNEYYIFEDLSDASYYYNVTSCDSVGNCNSTETRVILLDTIDPTIGNLSPSNETITSNTSINFTANITDDNVKNASLYIDDINTNSTNISSSGEVSWIVTLTDGIKNWFVRVFDWSGNFNDSDKYQITIDTSNPTLNIESPTNTTYDTDDIQINYTSDSDNVTYSLNGSSNISIDSEDFINAKHGSNELILYAIDEAGNVNSSSVTFEVSYVDLIEIDATTSPSNVGYNDNTSAVVTLDSNNVDIVYCNFTLTNPDDVEVISNQNGSVNGNIWNSPYYLINQSGSWFYNITCENELGTTNNTLLYFSIEDYVLNLYPDEYLFAARNAKDEVNYFDVYLYDNTNGSVDFNIFYDIDSLSSFNFLTSPSTIQLNNSDSQLDPTRLRVYIQADDDISDGFYDGNVTIKNNELEISETMNFTYGINPPSGVPEIYSLIGPKCSNNYYSSSCSNDFSVRQQETFDVSYLIKNEGDYDLSSCYANSTLSWKSVNLNNFSLMTGEEKTLTYTYGPSTAVSQGIYYDQVYITCYDGDSLGSSVSTPVSNRPINKINVLTAIYTGGGSGGGGGGGSGDDIIENESVRWIMETPQGTGSYKYTLSPNSFRKGEIEFENLGTTEREVTLKCEGDLCPYIKIDNNLVTLPVGLEIETIREFELYIGEDFKEGDYVANIIGKDDLGNEKILTIDATVGRFVVSDVSNKFVSSFNLIGIKIPYIVLFIIIWMLLSLLSGFTIFLIPVFKKLRWFLAVTLSLIISFIIIWLI
ncbi:MAG: hypothetical protein ACOCV1_00145 [Bacillota bacterium]